ncbi:MAG TPA: histidine kinase [Pseudolysinimonas sp.]|nr:histidine kinase [Pseudolysinimonas sp.]
MGLPSVPPPAARDARARRPIRALFARLFVINGALFTVGTLILALSPATVSSPPLWTEIPVLLIGLALILAVNGALVRASLAPLDSLTSVMQRADLMRDGPRLAEAGSGDLRDVVRDFNGMLDRLEAEHTASSAHTLAAQEGERQRIARELHDEIGQSLTVALLALKRVVDRAPEDFREDAETAQQAVRTSLEDVRQVAHRLRPGVLADLGLQSALASLGSEFSRSSGIPVTREVDPDLPELDGDIELVLYRVAQEGLTNVARHARASHVELTLRRAGDGLELRITDDGRGGPITEGAGVRGMRERASLIGARLTVSSRESGGTQVLLVVPDLRGGGSAG